MNNILSNSLFYAKNIISIKVKKYSKKGVSIIFEDDGPGIPLDKIDDVVKAFYRVDQSRLSSSGNTGLGLTITKDIVNGHGGSLKLQESKLGGLSVEIFLTY